MSRSATVDVEFLLAAKLGLDTRDMLLVKTMNLLKLLAEDQ